MAAELIGTAEPAADDGFSRFWTLRGDWVEAPNRRCSGESGVPEVALLDLEKARRRLSKKRAMLRGLWQFRRHSSLNEADWKLLIYGYEAAFGSAIKGLQA